VAAALSLIALHSSNLRFWQSEISLYQRCVASAPENPLFLMNLSNAMSRAQQPDTSCELLHKAVEEIGLDPRRGAPALTHFSLGNCLRRRGELPLALAEYDAAQRFAEGNFSQAYENAAVTLLDLGDDAAALARAEILVDRWPASATGFKLAGIVYARRGEFARAASELRHARERAPDDAEIASLLRRVEAENARSSGDR
jgi:tetratricopeptide (TPR) repeat protein